MFTSLTIKFPERKDEYGNPKPQPKWHAYNLIPQVREFKEAAEGYQMKMICWEIAGGNPTQYKILYEETLESEVIEMHGFYLAKLYPIE